MPLLLGIDPGLASTGYGLLADDRVVGCGTIQTPPGPAGPRLLAIVHELEALLRVHPVQEAALEELFMGRNRTSVIGVAQARGAILAALEGAGIPTFEYKPAQVKSILTGYGMADKKQMSRMLGAHVTGLGGKGAGARAPDFAGTIDDHAADAIAIAVCHSRSRRLRIATLSR